MPGDNNNLGLANPEEVGSITTSPKLEAAAETNIKNINLAALGENNSQQVTESFDDFVKNNAVLNNNANSIAVQESAGDITNLFYIDGKSVDEYLRTQVPLYDEADAAQKQRLAKAAIMKCLVSDSNNVDVKAFVQTADGRCEARVSNVVYADKARSASGFFRRRRAAARANAISAEDATAREINARSQEFTNKIARSQQRSEIQARRAEDSSWLRRAADNLSYVLRHRMFEPADAALNAGGLEDAVTAAIMYSVYEQRKAGNATDMDVLINAPRDIEYHEAAKFFNAHDFTLGVLPLGDGKEHKDIEEVSDIYESFMRTANGANIDGIVSLTNPEDVANKGYEIGEMVQTAAIYNDFFSAYRNVILAENSNVNQALRDRYASLTQTFSYYNKTVGMLSDMSFGAGYGKEGAEKAFAATLVYNAIGGAIKGKNAQQMQEMYPAADGKTYLDHLSEQMTDLVSEYSADYGLTAGDVQEFQRSGRLPEGIDSARFQSMYNNALAQAKENFVKAGGKLEAVNEATPQFIDNKRVPDMQKAAKRIAADAMASLAVQYEKINEKKIDENYQKEYGRLVEQQVTALLIQDGYSSKCRQAAVSGALEDDMQLFADNGGILPYNISKDIVNQAAKNALDGLNTLYPENKESIEKFNSVLNYEEHKDAPVSSIDGVGLGTYREPTAADTTFQNTAEHQRIVDSIKKVDYTVNTAANMHDAAREFDNFISFFPGYTESLNNPEVSKSAKGQVTNLFYIDGMPVEDYMEKIFPGFKNSTAAGKQNLEKIAIMKAIIEGKPAVDALYYSQDGKGNVNLNVRNIVYKGNTTQRKTALGRFFERQKNEARAKRIYNANKPTLNKIIQSVKEQHSKLTAEADQTKKAVTDHKAVNVIPNYKGEDEEFIDLDNMSLEQIEKGEKIEEKKEEKEEELEEDEFLDLDSASLEDIEAGNVRVIKEPKEPKPEETVTAEEPEVTNPEQPEVTNPEQPTVTNPEQPAVTNPEEPTVTNPDQTETRKKISVDLGETKTGNVSKAPESSTEKTRQVQASTPNTGKR